MKCLYFCKFSCLWHNHLTVDPSCTSWLKNFTSCCLAFSCRCPWCDTVLNIVLNDPCSVNSVELYISRDGQIEYSRLSIYSNLISYSNSALITRIQFDYSMNLHLHEQILHTRPHWYEHQLWPVAEPSAVQERCQNFSNIVTLWTAIWKTPPMLRQ